MSSRAASLSVAAVLLSTGCSDEASGQPATLSCSSPVEFDQAAAVPLAPRRELLGAGDQTHPALPLGDAGTDRVICTGTAG